MYRYWKSLHYPVVVTSDAILHTAHLTFDWHLRFLEIVHLYGDLAGLTDALLADTTARDATTGSSYRLPTSWR